MMPEQAELLVQARHSLSAAQLLQAEGYAGFAASAEAFLLGEGLAFSKHSGVHAAFGTHFTKTGVVPPEFHHDKQPS